MEQLFRPASIEALDCCESADYAAWRNRARAGGASISRRKSGRLRFFSHPLLLGAAAVASRAGFARSCFFENDHPPPRNVRDTHLRISLLRL
jgi:hypothetical protein